KNIQLLSKDYNKVVGIDNYELAIEYCKNKNLKTALLGELPNLNMLDDSSVDLILLFDVLEHVEDDKLALSVLKNKLNNQGHLLITVPAFSFLWSRHDEDFHHKRRYDLKQLKKMLTMLDFKIIKSSYLYFLLFPPVLFMRLLKKVFKTYSTKDDFKLNNKFLNFLLIKLLSIEEFFLNYLSFPFGSSILILVKKEKQNDK
ncbi:methyltransferase domain-containing protein, partial [Dolichospermum sp. ST_sed3]|nr:methyltransferase domain-containing protein [Dolichospermum sp. ST_sed3]